MTPDDFILLSAVPVVSRDVYLSQDGAPALGKALGMYYLPKLIYGSGGRADLHHAIEGPAMAPHANGCYLSVEHSRLIPSIVQGFESEFVEHFSRGCRVVPRCRGSKDRRLRCVCLFIFVSAQPKTPSGQH
jgi:hypothetical protein